MLDDGSGIWRRLNHARMFKRSTIAPIIFLPALLCVFFLGNEIPFLFVEDQQPTLRSALAQPRPSAFQRAQVCLQDSPHVPSPLPDLLTKNSALIAPEDLTAHYLEMLEVTKPLRDREISEYAGYKGPWIEDLWIKRFCCDRPISDFGGLVPLFLQWNDMANHARHAHYESPEFRKFFETLRRDVIYVTVSQSDNGINRLGGQMFPLASDTWNILVLSAGGAGHIPIPLLMGEQKIIPFRNTLPYLVSFAGTVHSWSPVRVEMMNKTMTLSSIYGFNALHYNDRDWKDIKRDTALNLAPRGFGRSSFHLYEIIQMGFIPVYVYDDHEWLPYQGSPAYLSEFGWSVKQRNFGTWLETIAHQYGNKMEYLHHELLQRRQRMLKFRSSHYTYDGVLDQVEFFLRSDPRSDLSCRRHPKNAIGYDEDYL